MGIYSKIIKALEVWRAFGFESLCPTNLTTYVPLNEEWIKIAVAYTHNSLVLDSEKKGWNRAFEPTCIIFRIQCSMKKRPEKDKYLIISFLCDKEAHQMNKIKNKLIIRTKYWLPEWKYKEICEKIGIKLSQAYDTG